MVFESSIPDPDLVVPCIVMICQHSVHRLIELRVRSQTSTYSFGMFTSSSHCDVFQPHYDEYDDERKPSMIAISNEKYIGKLDRDVVFDTTQACKTAE